MFHVGRHQRRPVRTSVRPRTANPSARPNAAVAALRAGAVRGSLQRPCFPPSLRRRAAGSARARAIAELGACVLLSGLPVLRHRVRLGGSRAVADGDEPLRGSMNIGAVAPERPDVTTSDTRDDHGDRPTAPTMIACLISTAYPSAAKSARTCACTSSADRSPKCIPSRAERSGVATQGQHNSRLVVLCKRAIGNSRALRQMRPNSRLHRPYIAFPRP